VPKDTEIKQCLGNCPAKDALHGERDLVWGSSSPTHCCTVLLLVCNETIKN